MISRNFPRPGLSLLTVIVSDGMGAVNLIFLIKKWKKNEFFTGMHIAAYGKVEYTYGKWQMNGPETETVSPDHLKDVQGWRPLYPLTEGIRMGQMRKLIQNALEQMGDIKENIPAPVVSQWNLWTEMKQCGICISRSPKKCRSRRDTVWHLKNCSFSRPVS